MIANGVLFASEFFGALNRDKRSLRWRRMKIRRRLRNGCYPGINAKDIEWLTAWDDWGVFRDGIHLKQNSHSGKPPRLQPETVPINEEFIERCAKKLRRRRSVASNP
uniref:Uncharacterized protein n=1 Tax=Moniliophthora roreri TaxID=221103 RepID=A0A0W0EZ53_MONRR